MKYIRTKDGISKMEEDIIEYVIKPNDIQFKQADTIEELCDVVVVKYNYQDLPRVAETMKNSKIQMINALKYNKTVEWIKLGIFTNKGLIYVAKMNDKGELELL